MILTSAPLRIALGGGGTDLPAWQSKHGAKIVTAAINLRIYVTVNRRYDDMIRVAYMETEFVDSVHKLKHDIVKETLRRLGVPKGGVEITTVADAPARSGLGSSAAFTVALLKSLYSLEKENKTRKDLAEEAFEIEKTLGKELGKQDQYATAFGGVSILQIDRENKVTVCPCMLKTGQLFDLSKNLLLFDTGTFRDAKSVLKKQNVRITESSDAMTMISEIGERIVSMFELRTEFSPSEVGILFNDHWAAKSSMTPFPSLVSNIYESGKKLGALGGKMLGAGVAGFMLFYVPEEEQSDFILGMKKLGLKNVPFGFDFDGVRVEAKT